MNKIPLKYTLTRLCLLVIILLCNLFMTENAFSRKHWTSDYFNVHFDQAANAIVMKFEFFDYQFGPADENGYLERCNYAYTTDGNNYNHLMSSGTDDQLYDFWSWLDMKNKLTGTKLQFNECYEPQSGTMWNDSISTQRVEVYNYNSHRAYLTMKWFMDTTYHDVIYIRITGKWHVNGVWPNEFFDEIYSIPIGNELKSDTLKGSSSQLNTKMNTTVSENISAKVYKDADTVVIKGADLGEIIHVYTTSGAQIKSIVTDNVVMKIKLAEKQIYIINIGQTHYRVAL